MTNLAAGERVAKELALDCFRRIYWRDPDPDDAGHQQDLREFETAGAAALAACAREEARPFKEALMVNPFSDGVDGDLCLWCRTSQPRGTTTFEEHFLPEHHLATCELILVLGKWAALERAAGERASLDPQGGRHDS